MSQPENDPSSFPETFSRADLEARQLAALRALLERTQSRNRFWRDRLQRSGLRSETLTCLADLRRLQTLTKQELVDDQLANPPYGTNLTAHVTKYSRLHQTSGTTGKPMRWLDTPESWNWLLGCWEQIYRIVGIRDDDVFAFPFSFGPFIGFWAAFEGAHRRGNLSLTMGGMSSEARLRMMFELNATIVCCTPTYALRLIEVADELKLDLASSSVRMLIVAGEPGASIPAIRQKIETAWGAKLIDHWGMTDIGSLGIEHPSASGGILILETECIAEVLKPDEDVPVSKGELGELVITNLGRWAQPVIRYRTGDLVQESPEPCPSGLKLMRLEGGILGRADDMVTIRGNNVFPSSLDAILREWNEIAEYRTTVMTRNSMPHLVIEVEPAFPVEGEHDSDPRCLNLVKSLSKSIKDRLNFHVDVKTAVALPRFELKGRRFFRENESRE